MPNKGFNMYENEIIEMEDFIFNHYIHHFDESESQDLDFNEEYSCIEAAAECVEEIIWN